MSMLGSVAAFICLTALAVHLLTTTLAIAKCRTKIASLAPMSISPTVAVIRPVSGLEELDKKTLETTFLLEYPNYEVIICAETEGDPAVEFVRDLIAKYPHIPARLLVGRTITTANPKLDNIDKAYRAARAPWIIFADCNVLLPRDYIQAMLATWQSDTGLVCAPPIGSSPESFWADVECAFLNSYQARWQYAADCIGYGFAQGKSMLWKREMLEGIGGIAALAAEIAEDAAATKIVRQAGLRVRLAAPPFFQPLGKRSFPNLWQRQTRWAQLRRQSFPLQFMPEIMTTSALPLLSGMIACSEMDHPIAPAMGLILLVWWSAEACLARVSGWPITWHSPFAWALRDLLIPVIWCVAWLKGSYEWRGTAVTLRSNTDSPLPS